MQRKWNASLRGETGRGPPVELVAVPYLDHAATTPLRPEALEAMLPFLQGSFGNPSGQHAAARVAKTAIEEAREQVAAALGAEPAEIVFTGGGTEADNLAVKGAARSARDRGFGDGVVTTAVEHHAVLHSCDRLARDGFRVTRVGVDPDGVVDLDALAAALDERTTVVSVMLANNEVGTIQPLAAVARVVAERAPRAVLHTDAVQAAAWLDVADQAAGAALIAVSAHKFGGPKGVGALVRRGDMPIEPLIEGGGQEWGLRSGTADVAGAVGMAEALRVTGLRRGDEVARIRPLRDRLARGRNPSRRLGPRRRVRGGGLVVHVGRDRAVARAGGDGPVPRGRAGVDPAEPRLRVDRG
jgi:cysteine desulfurase